MEPKNETFPHEGQGRDLHHQPRGNSKCLDKASDFIGEITGKGGKILFVGCKRQAQDSVAEAAEAIGQYYVNHRWLGGTLTNLATIRRSVERLKYLEDIEKSPDSKKDVQERTFCPWT